MSRKHSTSIFQKQNMLFFSIAMLLTLSFYLNIGGIRTFTGLEVVGYTVTATTGTPSDIQTAVDVVISNGGGTVYIPSGTFNWNGETVNLIGGVNIHGMGVGSTILLQQDPAPHPVMFKINGSNGRQTRITGIEFRGLVTSSNDNVAPAGAIRSENAVDFRIDHCKFIDFPNVAVSISSGASPLGTRGVIDHNVFTNPYKLTYGGIWGYGIIVGSTDYSTSELDITKFLGKYETAPTNFPVVYIEDNSFSYCRHSVASNQRGWYVARYNTITQARPTNYGQLDVHGSSSRGWGGRGLEAYNNIVDGNGIVGSSAFAIRGGGGVIYDNDLINESFGIFIVTDQANPMYPMADLYIWGNSRNDYDNSNSVYEENVHFFIREPTLALDGFTYTPYVYPHPLVSNTPLEEVGTLSVTTTPINGEIFVDGNSVGSGTYTSTYNALTSHSITFGAVTDYETPQSQSVTIQASQITTVIGTYNPIMIPPFGSGTLIVTTFPVAGQIFVDGSPTSTRGTFTDTFPAGVTVLISFGDYAGYTKPEQQTVVIVAEETINLVGEYTKVNNPFENLDLLMFTVPVFATILFSKHKNKKRH